MRTKTILHVDMDAFFASVEQRDNPAYRGKPLIVGAPRDARGVVSTCSYEARAFGVHSAMPTREAARLCPDAIFVPCDMAKYEKVSDSVMEIFERYTPHIEKVSIDEAYLDVTGSFLLFGDGAFIARAIKGDICRELELSASAGVACNKFLAKLCSECAKPGGLCVAPSEPDELAKFLAPLKVEKLFMVGPVLAAKLRRAGFNVVRDIQRASPDELERLVGKNISRFLLESSRGHGSDLLVPERDEQSISRERTFPEDCSDIELIRKALAEICDDVGARLRRAGKWASVARLKLRWANFTTITRQMRFKRPVRDDFALFDAARLLLDREGVASPVRLVGFCVTGLCDGIAEQEEFDFFGETSITGINSNDRRERLCDVMDAIRQRLGHNSIKRGS